MALEKHELEIGKYKELAENSRKLNYPFIGSIVSERELNTLILVAEENIRLSKKYIEYLNDLKAKIFSDDDSEK